MENRSKWMRLIGLALLAFLLYRIDTNQVAAVVKQASPALLLFAMVLNVPQVGIKAFRWRCLLASQKIFYGFGPTFFWYFGSLFIGLLTPGRLGEFVKTFYVSRDCGVSRARAFSSVLADRLFDLYVLLIVGGGAMLSLASGHGASGLASLLAALAGSALPLAIFLHDRTFGRVMAIGLRFVRVRRRFLTPDSWLLELRGGLKELGLSSLMTATMLTLLASLIFFSQCYLLALALGLNVTFLQVSYTVALGSLVTLLPISISGVGTREAAIVAYLSTSGVPPEASFGFSLLVFLTFYVGGGLIGALAWCVKPVPLDICVRMEKPEGLPRQGARPISKASRIARLSCELALVLWLVIVYVLYFGQFTDMARELLSTIVHYFGVAPW